MKLSSKYGLLREVSEELIALDTFDLALSEFIGSSYHFYMLDDGTLFRLLELVKPVCPDCLRGYRNALEILDLSKVIYRFTCARKFMLDDPGTNQLHLNSWGRLYVSEKLLTKEADLFRKQCVDSIKKHLCEHTEIYQELLDALLAEIDADNANKIKSMNACLSLKVVS